jgi:hypothetical protein
MILFTALIMEAGDIIIMVGVVVITEDMVEVIITIIALGIVRLMCTQAIMVETMEVTIPLTKAK